MNLLEYRLQVVRSGEIPVFERATKDIQRVINSIDREIARRN